MGSQVVYNTLVDAPPAIVVDCSSIGGGWRIAERRDGIQPNRSHGGIGPVVLRYELAPLPYRSQRAAETDAALIVARNPHPYDPTRSIAPLAEWRKGR